MPMQDARLALVPPEVLKLPFGRSIGSAVSSYMVKSLLKKYKDLDSKSTLEKVWSHERLKSIWHEREQ